MKTYHRNGTISDIEYLLTDKDDFAIQVSNGESGEITFYRNDNLVREIDSELVDMFCVFEKLYFSNLDSYYKETRMMPIGLVFGGQNSNSTIDKECFLDIKKIFSGMLDITDKYIYMKDCEYLISTVQNLVQSAEYCFVQYYVQIGQINLCSRAMNNTELFEHMSQDSMKLMFFVETFFIKLYSILDVMVKIVYELENPVAEFPDMVKLKSAKKLWGDRKNLSLKNYPNTIFEDCEVIRQIEALRNEAVHNGSWEVRPKVFLEVENQKIVERYMLFPDFEDGRLVSVKNRKHFFSKNIKVNDMLILIHDEFYRRLLYTLKIINEKY